MNNKERILLSLTILSLVALGLFISILINKKYESKEIKVGSTVVCVATNLSFVNRGKHMKVENIRYFSNAIDYICTFDGALGKLRYIFNKSEIKLVK
jgi:hypothetical protein